MSENVSASAEINSNTNSHSPQSSGETVTAEVPIPMNELKAVLNRTPQITYAPGFDYNSTVKAIFYTGLDYDGKQTRVFAYIGFPKGASKANKVPAVVCVHGGNGQAFGQWVQKWNEKGYAAIAMDNYGNIPCIKHDTVQFVRDPKGAAPFDATFATIDKPINQQWIFYAVSDAILANTILQSDERVIPDKIGLTGISWGGIISSITAGVDHRFTFAVPVYGCGYLDESLTYFGKYYSNPKVEELWDAAKYIAFIQMPVLWLNSDDDNSFPLNSFAKSAEHTPGGVLSILHGMQHGHMEGWTPIEIYTFADSICKNGKGLIRITSQPDRSMGKNVHFSVQVPPDDEVCNVVAFYITEPLSYQQTSDSTDPVFQNIWNRVYGTCENGKVTVQLPDGVDSYYVNVTAKRNFEWYTASTQFIHLK